MNRFKNISFLFIITFLLLIFSNQAFSKVYDNYKTLYLSSGNKITVLIPDNWHLQNKINYIFVDKKT